MNVLATFKNQNMSPLKHGTARQKAKRARTKKTKKTEGRASEARLRRGAASTSQDRQRRVLRGTKRDSNTKEGQEKHWKMKGALDTPCELDSLILVGKEQAKTVRQHKRARGEPWSDVGKLVSREQRLRSLIKGFLEKRKGRLGTHGRMRSYEGD